MTKTATESVTEQRRVVWGGVLVGLGIGGFFDGIVFHQVLQWHHMVSAVYPVNTVAGLELNTLGDGLFHVGAYLFTLTGLFLLGSAARRSHRAWPVGLLIGTLLLGWGLFNLVEGIVDHHLLQIHHVRAGPNQLAYDLGFLAWGALLFFGGWGLVRRGSRRLAARN